MQLSTVLLSYIVIHDDISDPQVSLNRADRLKLDFMVWKHVDPQTGGEISSKTTPHLSLTRPCENEKTIRSLLIENNGLIRFEFLGFLHESSENSFYSISFSKNVSVWLPSCATRYFVICKEPVFYQWLYLPSIIGSCYSIQPFVFVFLHWSLTP